ncbi:hypothetical protein CAAN1_04S05666 [[Candida] anglica]|uniref:CCD97-like C-terminal domain-containing protein n=1 Tax=[Candida] anglica TaxID=148631 RepID=A0ABP0ED35_9ASCO
MMSTPSNNIRRIQEQRHSQFQMQNRNGSQNQARHNLYGSGPSHSQQQLSSSNQHDYRKKRQSSRLTSKRTTNTNVKSKLLNLQQSSKHYYANNVESMAAANISQTMESFAIRKPIDNSSTFDHSVFTSAALQSYTHENAHTDPMRVVPPVKESQIKAWESAEKVAASLIFNNSSDSSDDESYTSNHISGDNKNIIKSLPGYTTNELEIVNSRYQEFQRRTKSQPTSEEYFAYMEQEEKKLLWEYRQRHQVSQERVFAQYSSLNDKRKIQISQKKELLSRIFGSGNNLNCNFITNNLSMPILENNYATSQQTFQEDKEEISQLLEEHGSYKANLEDALKVFMSSKNQFFSINSKARMKNREGANDDEENDDDDENDDENMDEFNREKFEQLISLQLNKRYEEQIAKLSEDDTDEGRFKLNANIEKTEEENNEEDEELQNFGLEFLRKCLKEETESSSTNDLEVF